MGSVSVLRRGGDQPTGRILRTNLQEAMAIKLIKNKAENWESRRARLIITENDLHIIGVTR